MAAFRASSLKTVLAKCMPYDLKNVAKFQVKTMEFDSNLNMHFAKHESVFALNNDVCKPGDIVLIERILGPRTSKDITHQIKKVVYPFGDITDPVTGKKVVISKYRDEIEERNKLFGKNPDGFDFNKAPERGWQKDKRDFTYRDTYRKYHLFEKEDPYAV